MFEQEKIIETYRALLFELPKISRFNNILPYVLHYIPEEKGAFILDAGCGNGNYSYFLSDLGYRNIFACDLFESINTDKFNYVKATLEQLPFNDNTFDFVLAPSVIYYLKDTGKVLKEIHRVLKKNGILLFSAHTKYSLFSLWRISKCILGLRQAEHFKYVHFLSASKYIKILKTNRFQVIHVDGYNLSFFLFPLYKYFARVLEVIFSIKMPFMDIKITKNKALARIKSEIAYHSVIVAKKIDTL